MSYDIYVKHRKDGTTVSLREKHQLRGGTYAVGGETEAHLNITYNYAKWFYKLWPSGDGKAADAKTATPFEQMYANNAGGIRSLYGKPLDEVIAELGRAISKLKGDRDQDYWKKTEGNARAALFDLKCVCEFARFENPDADLTIDGD